MDYTYTAPSGRVFKIRARICDPITRRYAVRVDGVEVGRMFAIPEAAIDRGIEYARNVDAGRVEYA